MWIYKETALVKNEVCRFVSIVFRNHLVSKQPLFWKIIVQLSFLRSSKKLYSIKNAKQNAAAKFWYSYVNNF